KVKKKGLFLLLCFRTPDRSREIISYKELKPVRSEVKLLHHLVVFNDVKLEVFWTNSLKSSSSGFVSISQNSSSSIFFTNLLCVVVVQVFLILDPCVDCCSGCVIASDNVCGVLVRSRLEDLIYCGLDLVCVCVVEPVCSCVCCTQFLSSVSSLCEGWT
ncbi:hypothetical protein Taro_043299, partial [Colocasia esculenta]|nr:hypothetical protein [Colocasia esculenta]